MYLSRQIVPETKSAPATKPEPQVSMTPAQAERLSQIKQRAGWIPPDYQVQLAKSNATDQAVDAVANMKAKQIVDDQASEEEGGWWRRNVYDRLKAGTRWGFAGLNFVPEFVQGGLAQIVDEDNSTDGWFISSTLGSMIANPELQGEGFFADEKLMEKQAERARRYRGTVNGSAWTVGRGAANIVFKTNSKPYNIMSGILDALVTIKFDPTGPVTKATKAATAKGLTVAGKELIKPSLVPLFADETTAALREALESQAGVTRGLAEATLDGTKFDNFTRTNGRMVRLIDRLTGIKNPLRIAEIFDYKLPNEMVAALAETSDPDVIRAILGAGWTIKGGTPLPQDIRLLQGGRIKTAIGNLIVERAPMLDGLRKSRYFTTMGDAKVVIHGTQDDNRNAVKSIVSYLRTAGVDEKVVEDVAGRAFVAFSPKSSSAARKEVMDLFYDTMRQVMKLDGVSDEAIDELYKRGGKVVDRIQLYLMDRLGQPFDGGYASHLLNKNRDYVPEEEIEGIVKSLGLDSGSKATIVSPTELVELLDRTIILPDLREVRRLTRNPFFRELVGESFKKLPITAKRSRRLVEVITDEKRFDEIQQRLAAIVQRNLEIDELKKAGKQFDTDELKALGRERVALQEEAASLKVKEYRKVISPDQRAALVAIDFMQNELWKPLALATGGYVVRNSLDAQVRMAFSELPSVFTHPFEYINLVLGTSKKMSLRLENLVKMGGIENADEVISESLADVRKGLTFGLRENGLGANAIEDQMTATGTFSRVDRDMVNGLRLHTDAVVQNGRRTQADTLRKVAAQTFAEMGGYSPQARQVAVNRIVNIIKSDENIRKEIDDMHAYGFEIGVDGKKTRIPSVDLTVLPEDEQYAAYAQYAQRITVSSAQILTGSIPEAEFMYAFGYVPKTSGGKMVGAFEQNVDELTILEKPQSGVVGATVQLGDNEIGIITRVSDLSGEFVIDPFDGSLVEMSGNVATVQPVFPDKAFDSPFGSREARKLIETMPVSDSADVPGLPKVLKRELMLSDAGDKNVYTQIKESWDPAVNWFFGSFYGTITNKLERSPVFREYYYRQVADLADRLKPEDAQRFLDEAAEKAKEAGMKIEDYVGDKQLVSILRKSATTAGDVTLEQLDDYAKYVALNKTKELLYDASNRSNLEDALRVIMPFAPAWREITTTYLGFLKSNPINSARSFQRVYSGLQGADPDNDGRGFFYQDPNTNQMMFTFPASGTLAKVLTGLDAPLEAPVKRLSQGIQAFPALGPMGQVAASKILPHLPEAEFFTGLLLPYGLKGPTTAFNPTPQWLQKATQVFTAPTADLETQYANTYIETMRALSASGDYDLSSKDDNNQLESDAKFKARILMGFRALSQFFGPTAGATEFKIPTEQGDRFVSQLIKEFYDMQANPDIGYEKAVPEFLRIYGDEAALYVASKTRSVAEGLEATKEFQDWADANAGLVKDYASVANYLAPAGSDFNFAVWSLQLQRGERVRLTDREVVELAQQRIGSAKYRDARRQVGPYPSDAARDALKRYREFLHGKYPGFPAVAEFEVGSFYNDILSLKDLVDDPRAANNETAVAIREYLIARERAIAVSGVSEQGFKTAKSAARARAGLESIGISLAEKYPGFSRIFDRLLASEVE